MRTLELLAPAKNLECGIAAIDHGADAVYIGAPRFGARAAAGNSIEDIKQLCDYAHQFGAKVHVTVNTIIYDSELEDTLKMISQLDEIGVDALLLQDMGLLWEVRAKGLWKRELHSSTQCDTRTPEKALWLTQIGFKRVVLARELSLDEIKAIHNAIPDREIEVFVHGALCVCYSGVCYASEKCFSRSANRGECAQFCRMKFDLVDADNQMIERQRYLLSLKDLCQLDYLKDLADAGASSFKIEGRLKDITYVKNVVAAYNKKLDEIVAKYPREYRRASRGHVEYNFVPNLKKTFNRGFTNYFLHGRQPDISSFDTPKAIGEYVGKVKEIRGNVSFNVATVASFANGDGLCFINDERELEGFRVNKVAGNRLFPFRMPENLRPGMALYRNNDQAFEQILARKTAERRIPLFIELQLVLEKDEDKDEVVEGFLATANIFKSVEQGLYYKAAEVFTPMQIQRAKRSQHDNMIAQMSKFGESKYECKHVVLKDDIADGFIPNSVLSNVRRELIQKLDQRIADELDRSLISGMDRNFFASPYRLDQPAERKAESQKELTWQPEYGKWRYTYNIANEAAVDFYKVHGLEDIQPAFELGANKLKEESLIMQCRHCIRYSLGYCVKRGGKKPAWKEPLSLVLGDGRRFRLEFVCKECQMNVYAESN
nr:U32 family peptidase [uncultured Prevotella sp.]